MPERRCGTCAFAGSPKGAQRWRKCTCKRTDGPWWAWEFRYSPYDCNPYMLPNEGTTCACYRPREERSETDE